jgi:hypothetical protein
VVHQVVALPVPTGPSLVVSDEPPGVDPVAAEVAAPVVPIAPIAPSATVEVLLGSVRTTVEFGEEPAPGVDGFTEDDFEEF